MVGVRVLLAFALAGMAGILIERGAGAAASLILPPAAAILAVHATLFDAGYTRLQSVRQICIMIGAGVLTLTIVALLRPWAWPLPISGGELLLIPVAFLAVYLRRFGPLGIGTGVIVFVLAVYGMPYPLTWTAIPWILYAGAIALVAALALRFVSSSPEVDQVAIVRAAALRREVVRLLRDCRTALRAGRGDDLQRAAARRGALGLAWNELRSAVEGEVALDHPNRPRLERAVFRLYVLEQAMKTLTEALIALAPAFATVEVEVRARISRVLDRLTALAEAGRDPPADLVEATAVAGQRLEATAVQPGTLDINTRMSLLRIAFASRRVVRSVAQPLRIPAPGGLGAQLAAGAPAGSGPSPFVRMGAQAAIGTAIIVLLDYLLHLGHAYWAILSAALILATSVADTWLRAVQRAVGTAIGVILALMLGPLCGHAPIVMVPAGAIAVVLAVATVKSRYGIASGAVGFCMVVALDVFVQSPASVLVSRIWETLLGSVVGLVVAMCVLPMHLTKQIDAAAHKIIGAARETCLAALAIASRPGEAVHERRTGPALLGLWATEQARFRNLAAETRLRPGIQLPGPLLLAQLDALIDQVALLDDSVALLESNIEPEFAELAAELHRRAGAGFAAVLGHLEGRPCAPPRGPDDLVNAVAAALRFEHVTGASDAAAFIARVQVLYHARRVVQVLVDLAASLDAQRRRETTANEVARLSEPT